MVRGQEEQPPSSGAAAARRGRPGDQRRDQGRPRIPHGGVFLDIASRRTPEFISERLPSMYHQFHALADVDITAEPMEIGPTCHYVMGGVEVDPDTAREPGRGPVRRRRVPGGMHGSNRLGGNSLSDLLVFGQRAGEAQRGVRQTPADGPRRSTMPTS